MSAQVDIAQAIASIAHRGQVDKTDAPYILHPARVAATLQRNGESSFVVAAGWLHDVIEDSDITANDLTQAGVDWSIVKTVIALTRTREVGPEDYYETIRQDYSARMVKLADIADNLDPDRLALLDDATIVRLTRKYAKARLLLGVSA